jgi:hypothetical protein
LGKQGETSSQISQREAQSEHEGVRQHNKAMGQASFESKLERKETTYFLFVIFVFL